MPSHQAQRLPQATPQQRPQAQQWGAGRGNAALLDQLQLADANQQVPSQTPEAFSKTNLYTAMERLTSKEGWSDEFAAAWLGQAVVETGKTNLEQLDVLERNGGAGRGMFQYTGARRHPYDRARRQALANGQDLNDINWQIDYALEKDNPAMDLDAMRQGLSDPDQNYTFTRHWGVSTGKTPTGRSYGNRFNDANSLMSAYGEDRLGGYTRALTGEYTRPGEHHIDRRNAAAKRILGNYRAAKRLAQQQQERAA